MSRPTFGFPAPSGRSLRMKVGSCHPWRNTSELLDPQPEHPVQSFAMLRLSTGQTVMAHPLGRAIHSIHVPPNLRISCPFGAFAELRYATGITVFLMRWDYQ